MGSSFGLTFSPAILVDGYEWRTRGECIAPHDRVAPKRLRSVRGTIVMVSTSSNKGATEVVGSHGWRLEHGPRHSSRMDEPLLRSVLWAISIPWV